MRYAFIPLVLLSIAACSRGNHDKAAIRQGVVDHLSGTSINLAAMDLDVTDVQYQGDKADATVLFKAKGMTAAQGMTLHYQMQQKGAKWEVVGVQDSGHSGTLPPGTANPHGATGEAPSGNPHGVPMPSPDELPPVGKK